MLERIIELTAENLGADAATITAETSFKDDLHALLPASFGPENLETDTDKTSS